MKTGNFTRLKSTSPTIQQNSIYTYIRNNHNQTNSDHPTKQQQQMSLLFFYFFAFLSPLLFAGAEFCAPTRCRKGGPLIQYPFRIADRHPQNCAYPGLDVRCSGDGDTLLDLPLSISLSVRRIDYRSQTIQLSDPGKCLPQKLQNLNLSSSPFRFVDGDLGDYVLFNCSVSKRDLAISVPCLRDSGSQSQFYAVTFDAYMDALSLTSCTSFHNISSVPRYIFSRNDVRLNWSEPACGSRCEALGKRCAPLPAPSNTSSIEFQCIDKPRSHEAENRKRLIAGDGFSNFRLV